MERIAIITGASKGIGKATAKKFLEENWRVINISRTPCDVDGVMNVIQDLKNDNLKDSMQGSVKHMLKQQDKICLIHNACAYFPGAVSNENLENVNTAWKVNILAPMILNQLIVPYMKKESSILYIGSTLSETAVPGAVPYVVSKHAVLGLMRSTCQDLSPKGIHTCCICPGFTETEMLRAHLDANGRNIYDIANMIIMKRLIQPQEIANFIFCCAEQPVVNGSTLHANLGSINK